MRRHPLALAMYVTVFGLGMIFLTHFGYGRNTEADLFPGVAAWAIWGWKVLMVCGGGGGIVMLLSRPRQSRVNPDSPKWPEGIAAGVAGFGLVVYLAAVLSIMGTVGSGPSILFFGTMALGLFWRGGQAIVDSHRLENLAGRVQTGSPIREETGNGVPE